MSAASDEGIYYRRIGLSKDQLIGPLTKRQLAELIFQKEIKAATHVRIKGQWTTCEQATRYVAAELRELDKQKEEHDAREEQLRELAAAYKVQARQTRKEERRQWGDRVREMRAKYKASTGADKFPNLCRYLAIFEVLVLIVCVLGASVAIICWVGGCVVSLTSTATWRQAFAGISASSVICGICLLLAVIGYIIGMAAVEFVRVFLAIEVNTRPPEQRTE